jgi:hypothetical protein
MVQSKATTPEAYLAELPEERREVISAVREMILHRLPQGYSESINYGMLSYEIPLSRYPKTYNKQPLSYVALAAQKNFNSIYLMGVYGSPEREATLREGFRKIGKKPDMGKSCLHFNRLDDLPLDAIGELIASVSVDQYIAIYEASRKK